MPRAGAIPFRTPAQIGGARPVLKQVYWWVIPRVRSLSSDPRNDSGKRTLDGATSRHNTPALVKDPSREILDSLAAR